jgi:hypothetical protein
MHMIFMDSAESGFLFSLVYGRGIGFYKLFALKSPLLLTSRLPMADARGLLCLFAPQRAVSML